MSWQQPHTATPKWGLDITQEQMLFEHYNVGYSDKDRPGPHTGVAAEETGLTGTVEAGSHPVHFGAGEVNAGRVAGVPGLPTTEPSPRLRRYS